MSGLDISDAREVILKLSQVNSRSDSCQSVVTTVGAPQPRISPVHVAHSHASAQSRITSIHRAHMQGTPSSSFPRHLYTTTC